jgi:hypothetical protein
MAVSSTLLLLVVLKTFTDVSEVLPASIMGAMGEYLNSARGTSP